jgi:hypothetical protein
LQYTGTSKIENLIFYNRALDLTTIFDDYSCFYSALGLGRKEDYWEEIKGGNQHLPEAASRKLKYAFMAGAKLLYLTIQISTYTSSEDEIEYLGIQVYI